MFEIQGSNFVIEVLEKGASTFHLVPASAEEWLARPYPWHITSRSAVNERPPEDILPLIHHLDAEAGRQPRETLMVTVGYYKQERALSMVGANAFSSMEEVKAHLDDKNLWLSGHFTVWND